MKRLTPYKLIRQNLRRKSLRSGILAGIVFLFCCTLYMGTVIGKGVGDGTRIMAERLGADVLFVPYGYEGKLQNSLLRGEPSSFYMDSRFAGVLQEEKGVGKVSTQLFIATLKAACCTLPVQLIGIDPETDFVVRPWMLSALKRPLAENEVVVGNKINGEIGESIRLFGKDLTIAARLDATGIGFDTSIFLDINRARRLLLLSDLGPSLNLPENLDRNAFVSSTLLKAAPGTNIKELANELSQKYAIEYNLDFVVVAGMVSDIAGKLHVFSGFFHIFSGMLWLLALIILALVFSAVIQERKKEFGVCRVIGASRGALASLVLREALLVSAAGAFFGVTASALILSLFKTYIGAALQLPTISPEPLFLLLTGGGVFLLGLATGPLACLPAICRLARVDAYAAMREEA